MSMCKTHCSLQSMKVKLYENILGNNWCLSYRKQYIALKRSAYWQSVWLYHEEPVGFFTLFFKHDHTQPVVWNDVCTVMIRLQRCLLPFKYSAIPRDTALLKRGSNTQKVSGSHFTAVIGWDVAKRKLLDSYWSITLLLFWLDCDKLF